MGHRSNCGAQFPPSFYCRHCHSRCPSSQLCPLAETLHCPGTYQPRWPRDSRSFCWDPARSCTKAPTHTLVLAVTIYFTDVNAKIHRGVFKKKKRKEVIYLLWLSVLCRRGFIRRAGISFWGDSC